MKGSASLFLLLLMGCAQYALAQQAGDGLYDQQRFGRQMLAQACGVRHLPPARNAKTYGPLLNKTDVPSRRESLGMTTRLVVSDTKMPSAGS